MQRGISPEEGNRVVRDAEPRIRLLGPDDLPQVLALSTEADWNQTAKDWLFFLEQAHAYGLEHAEHGVVATTVAWDLPPAASWIAMVLVAKAWRGRGFAGRLMRYAITAAESRGLAAALDATHLGEPVYRRMGFDGGEPVARWYAERPAAAPAGPDCLPLTDSALAAVAELDARCSGFTRKVMLLDRLRRLPQAAWMHRDRTGGLDGFVLGREGRVAGQIGPLFSKNVDDAKALLGAALADWSGGAYIDVPVRQTEFCRHLEVRGFGVEREFKRMTRPAGAGSPAWSHTFAIAGPDFG